MDDALDHKAFGEGRGEEEFIDFNSKKQWVAIAEQVFQQSQQHN